MKTILLLLLLTAFSVSVSHARFAGGSGTESDPYQVETAAQLQDMRRHADRHFIQTKDIDAGIIADFIPIGDYPNPFTGSFDGNGFKITGLTILLCPVCPGINVGFFGRVMGGRIKNVLVSEADIAGRDNVGGLAGFNNGEISNSLFSGKISGRDHVGGIAGWNEGEIWHSSSHADISGNTVVGGIAGHNTGKILESYSLSAVRGDQEVGGLAGVNDGSGSVSSTFAAGELTARSVSGGIIGYNGGTVESSYWDKQVMQLELGIGRGKTGSISGLMTSQMTGTSAYLHMSELDFETSWLLTESYPALFWEDVDALDLPTRADKDEASDAIELAQNYPNPFNHATILEYSIPERTHITLQVYNVSGYLVASLVNENKAAGRHQVRFDATGLSSGVYMVRLRVGDTIRTASMALIR